MGFIAPEVKLGKDYSLACDVYAFGLMIYSLLFNLPNPFSTQYRCPTCAIEVRRMFETKNLDYHVANCNLRPLLLPEEVSKQKPFLVELMIRSWDNDPFQRPSFEDICRRFELESEEKFVVIHFSFPKHKGVKDQCMFLDEPYTYVKMVKWIEKKFAGSNVVRVMLPIDKYSTDGLSGSTGSDMPDFFNDLDEDDILDDLRLIDNDTSLNKVIQKKVFLSSSTTERTSSTPFDPFSSSPSSSASPTSSSQSSSEFVLHLSVELNRIDEMLVINEYNRVVSFEEFKKMEEENQYLKAVIEMNKKTFQEELEMIPEESKKKDEDETIFPYFMGSYDDQHFQKFFKTELSVSPSSGVLVMHFGHLETRIGMIKEEREEDVDDTIYRDTTFYASSILNENMKPRRRFPSVITQHRDGIVRKKLYGKIERSKIFESYHPFPMGVPRSMPEFSDFLKNVTRDTFHQHPDNLLRFNSFCCPVPPTISFDTLTQMIDLLLGELECPAVYFPTTSWCTMFQSGRVTGIALESGYSCTTAAAIYEGEVIRHGVQSIEFGGGDITDYLARLTRSRFEDAFQYDDGLTYPERESLRNFKHEHCFIASDFVRTLQFSEIQPHSMVKSFELPDGRRVDMTAELFRSTELLFRPLKPNVSFDTSIKGIHELVVECGESSHSGDVKLETALFENIVLGGGSLKFSGVKERLSKEIVGLLMGNQAHQAGILRVNVENCGPKEKMELSAWLGATKLSSLKGMFCELAISKEEYEEFGSNVAYRKAM